MKAAGDLRDNEDGTPLDAVSTYCSASGSSDESDEVSQLTQEELTETVSNISAISQDRRVRLERAITHYENMEKGITRMPQFTKTDEFLKCLSQFTIQNENLEALGKLRHEMAPQDENVKYEIIIENQRGVTLFGSKFYGKQSVLYPIDPPKYQTLTGKNLTNLAMYPEPGHDWNWRWKHWHVMMINDVDEEGWIYSAIRFGSYKWSGVGKFGNFVRRRIWVRMAERTTTCKSYIRRNAVANGIDSELESVINVSSNYKDLKNIPCNSTEDKLPHTKATVFSLHRAVPYSLKPKAKKDLSSHYETKPGKEQNAVPVVSPVSITVSTDSDSSEEADSIVSLSKETLIETARNSILFPGSEAVSVYPLAEDNENIVIIENTYDNIGQCRIDRQKIEEILKSLFSFDDSTLSFLLTDYRESKNVLDSWLFKFIDKLRFNDSKRIFISQFKNRLETSHIYTQNLRLLKGIYSLYEEEITKSSYDRKHYIES